MSERLAIGEAIIAGIGASDNALDQVQDIINNLAKAGFVIVPLQPTEAMREASQYYLGAGFNPDPQYEAMIRAALAS